MAGDKLAQFGGKELSRACLEKLPEEPVNRRSARVAVPTIFHQPIADRAEDPIEGIGDHLGRQNSQDRRNNAG